MYSLTGDGISQKLIELSEIKSSASEIDNTIMIVGNILNYGGKSHKTSPFFDNSDALELAQIHGSVIIPEGTYYISRTFSQKTGTSLSGISSGKSELKALTGFSGAMIIDKTAGDTLSINRITLNSNHEAQHCIKTTQTNTPNFVINDVVCRNATSHGLYLEKAITASLFSVKSDSNGGDGFLLTDSNGLTLLNCIGIRNAGNGLTISKGSNSFSSGIRVVCGQYEDNGNHGIEITNASSLTIIIGAWVEANINDGIKIGNNSSYVPFAIRDTNVFIANNTLSDNWAINCTLGAKGSVTDNYLFNSGGNRNFVYDANNGSIEALMNKNGNAGEILPTVFPLGSAVISISNDIEYVASKHYEATASATVYVPIMTAKAQSTLEVTITGADNSSGVAGTFIVKTFTTSSANTRVSFAEIGGAINPKTEGVYYFPVGTSTQAPKVRWNGDTLEIATASGGSNKMNITVKAGINGKSFIPVWLI